MKRFPCAHATHPQWAMAVGLAVAQLRAQMALPEYAHAPSLGLVYITDHNAAQAERILQMLKSELPGVGAWSGATGMGVCAPGVQYLREPAISVMLCDFAPDQYRVFSGIAPISYGQTLKSQIALVHADASSPDLPELIDELATRTERGYLFGGLCAARHGSAPQFSWSGLAALGKGDKGDGGASGVFYGGLSGVVFGRGVKLASRIAQGCRPISRERRITAVQDNCILTLDDKPALDVLISDLRINSEKMQQAVKILSQTLAGLAQSDEDGVRPTGDFGPGVRVRSIVGMDAKRRSLTLSENVTEGQRLAFCRPDPQTAYTDLVRICSEIREVLDTHEAMARDGAPPQDRSAPPTTRIQGAHYVCCARRSNMNLEAHQADLTVIKRTLGDVPLTGWVSTGEVAYRYLYGYCGVLTVFAQGAGA